VTRSASVEEFTEAMKELHNQVKGRLLESSQEYNVEPINIENNFSLRLVIWFWHI
jgi:hypothetical protein